MAEDVAALSRIMEEIRLRLPRFDECISLLVMEAELADSFVNGLLFVISRREIISLERWLCSAMSSSSLRTEIDELKAGKHDHRLNEMVANPVDAHLYAALAKDVDGGLPLPPAPSLSDSEDNADEDGAGSTDGDRATGSEDKDAGRLEEVTKEDPGGKDELVVDVEGQTEDGQTSALTITGDEHEAKGPGETGTDRKPEPGNCEARQLVQEAKVAVCTEMTSPGEPLNGNGASPVTSIPAVAADRVESSKDGVKVDVKMEATASASTNGFKRDQQHRAHAPPLRDRPPAGNGGGPRLEPAPPAPSSSTQSLSPAPPSPNQAKNSSKADGGTVKEERRTQEREDVKSTTTEAVSTAGGNDAAAVTSGSKHGQSVESPFGKGHEVDCGGEGRSATLGWPGRKRPRTPTGTPDKARERRPPSKPRERADDGGAESLTDEEAKAAARDAEHFRRIALEVWERVNKHKFAIIFRKAVNPKDAPGYEKVIKKPMDLSLIRQRIMSGALTSLDDMSRDLFIMCNNAMVFNGVGDPYFEYSKELRTYASSVIEEARQPGFVTADPGFDSVVAGSRTSRRPPELMPAAVPPWNNRVKSRKGKKGTAGSARRGRGGAGTGGGTGAGAGSSRSKGRDSDTASVADDEGDEEGKARHVGGDSKGSMASMIVDVEEKEKGRSGAGKRRKMYGKGSKSRASSDDGESVQNAASSSDSSDAEEVASQGACSASDAGAEKEGKKRGKGSKGKKRARQASEDSSQDEQRGSGKGRKVKVAAKQKGRSAKKRPR